MSFSLIYSAWMGHRTGRSYVADSLDLTMQLLYVSFVSSNLSFRPVSVYTSISHTTLFQVIAIARNSQIHSVLSLVDLPFGQEKHFELSDLINVHVRARM